MDQSLRTTEAGLRMIKLEIRLGFKNAISAERKNVTFDYLLGVLAHIPVLIEIIIGGLLFAGQTPLKLKTCKGGTAVRVCVQASLPS